MTDSSFLLIVLFFRKPSSVPTCLKISAYIFTSLHFLLPSFYKLLLCKNNTLKYWIYLLKKGIKTDFIIWCLKIWYRLIFSPFKQFTFVLWYFIENINLLLALYFFVYFFSPKMEMTFLLYHSLFLILKFFFIYEIKYNMENVLY